MDNKIPLAILGATGSVGQKFIELLSDHPWFEIRELAASERSAGKKYADVVNWIMRTPINTEIAEMVVQNCIPNMKSKLVFSALDSSVAGEVESRFAEAGCIVVSNAKNHRMDDDVPLMIPEVNTDHLKLINHQKTKGAIVANPNCSTIGLTLALKPLHDQFGIEELNVVTMQAVSGSGYPGLSSLDIIDNVIPYISGEEPKLELEPQKILGSYSSTNNIEYANFKVSAQCSRVPVIDGHLECVQINFKSKPGKDEIISAWNNYQGEPQKLNLPFAPSNPIIYFQQDNYPQPKLHRDIENGMAVSVGRLRECSLFQYKFVVLSHNTVRGAAGGTILIAELMKTNGYLDKII